MSSIGSSVFLRISAVVTKVFGAWSRFGGLCPGPKVEPLLVAADKYLARD